MCSVRVPVNHRLFPLPVLLLAFLVILGESGFAQDARKRGKVRRATTHDVSSIVKLGRSLSGDESFFDVTIYGKDEKGKKTSSKAFLKIDEKVPLFVDRVVKIEHLKEGDSVIVFGRPVETEVEERGGPGRGGGGAIRRGWDRQIQNCKVLLAGEQLDRNEAFKDRRDNNLRWIRSKITSTVGGIWIMHDGNRYKITLAKKAPMIKRFRMETEKERLILKKAKYLHVNADSTKSRPLTKSRADAKKDCFVSTRLIMLDSRLLSSGYPMLFP